MSQRRRRFIRVAGALLSTVLLVPLVSTPAAAETEYYFRPDSDSFEFSGHGWGHGRGLSQWGAYGAAEQDLTYQEITAFYYPGTSLTTQSDSDIRVWIKADDDDITQIEAASGLSVTVGAITESLPLTWDGSAVLSWRVIRDAAGLHLQRQMGSNSWAAHSVGGVTVTSQPVTFSSSSGMVRLIMPDGTRREYLDRLRAAPIFTSRLLTLAVLKMESYLRTVVPSEMPSSWPTEALRAQSVAARTYASFERAADNTVYDTCDTTSCQVFKPFATYRADGSLIGRYSATSTDEAVVDTRNRVLHHDGRPALTQFGAANGGWTVAGLQPYLVSRADPYDGYVANSAHSWTRTIAASTIEGQWPEIGPLTRIRVLTRDGNGEWGGRITELALDGVDGTVEVSGELFRGRLGMRSSWWVVTNAPKRRQYVDPPIRDDGLQKVSPEVREQIVDGPVLLLRRSTTSTLSEEPLRTP